MKKVFTFFILHILFLPIIFSQTATIFGVVTEGGTNQPIEFVTVYIKETNKNVQTNAAGEYSLTVPVGKTATLQTSLVGYKEAKITIDPMRASAQKRIDITLVVSTSLQEVVVKESRIKDNGMIREDVKDFKLLPTTTGNLESVLPHIALGTNSGSGGELTSQ